MANRRSLGFRDVHPAGHGAVVASAARTLNRRSQVPGSLHPRVQAQAGFEMGFYQAVLMLAQRLIRCGRCF